MVKMKYLLIIIAILCLTFSLTGCKKLVGTEYKDVKVTVTDEYHRGTYVIPVRVGKVTTMQVHPAVYKIYIEYNGNEYVINDNNTYYNYKDKIGQTANGTLEIHTYDDGTIKYNIISLE